MVTVLQLNRLELKDMITAEIAENPVLEELRRGWRSWPGELQPLLEAERVSDPSDQSSSGRNTAAAAEFAPTESALGSP